MDDYMYDEEPTFLQGSAAQLYTAWSRLTGRLASTAGSVLLLPYHGVRDTFQWVFFTVHFSQDDFRFWHLCSRHGCNGLFLVLTTLLLSCGVFGVILYVIVVKKNKWPFAVKSRSDMVTTSTQVEDLRQGIQDLRQGIHSTRHLSDSRIDSITDDNTSRNVRMINSSCEGDRGDRLLCDRISGDRLPVTKAYRRTISFSEDVDIRPAYKKRRLPVSSKTDVISPRKPTSLSASSVSLSVRNKQSSTALYHKRRSDGPTKTPVRSSVSKILSSDRSVERQKSPFVLLGPKKSKTRLKTDKSSSSIRSQSLKSRSGSFIQVDQKPQKQTSVKLQSGRSSKRLNTSTRNKSNFAQSLNTTRAEGIFTNKKVHETNTKLFRKKPLKEKHTFSSKYNTDAYLIDHERPRGAGCGAVFSTSRPTAVYPTTSYPTATHPAATCPTVTYPSQLVRPHATREHDYHSSHIDFLPPRKTDTPEIQSFKGQGAFTPMFKDRIEKNSSWCNNTTRVGLASSNCPQAARKMFRSDKLLFHPAPPTTKLFHPAPPTTKPSAGAPRVIQPRMFAQPEDTNVNSLRNFWLNPAVLQNRTDNSAVYPPEQTLDQTLVGGDQKDVGDGGVRKENLNFMLSSKPRSVSRRRAKVTGVKADHLLSSSSSTRSRTSKGGRRRQDHLSNSSIRHALESGLVRTRHPLKPLLRPQVTDTTHTPRPQVTDTTHTPRMPRDTQTLTRDVIAPCHVKAFRDIRSPRDTVSKPGGQIIGHRHTLLGDNVTSSDMTTHDNVTSRDMTTLDMTSRDMTTRDMTTRDIGTTRRHQKTTEDKRTTGDKRKTGNKWTTDDNRTPDDQKTTVDKKTIDDKKTPDDQKTTVDKKTTGNKTTAPVSAVSAVSEARSVCRCAEDQETSDVMSTSTDDSRVETCRFCQKVPRPLTSHRHKPYDAVTSRSLRHRKWPRLDRNNCSPRKQQHFYLVAGEEDAASVDSDLPPEMNPRLNAGTDSRHVILPGGESRHVILPGMSGAVPKTSKTSRRPRFKVNKYVAPENSGFKVFTPTKLGTDLDKTNDKNSDDLCTGAMKSPIKTSSKLDMLSPGSYTDFLTYCRSVKSALDIKGVNSSYAKYLRHCYEEKSSSKKKSVSGDEPSKVLDSCCVKNAEVQTSPNLNSSKSCLSKNKSSLSRSVVPRLVYNKLYRQHRLRRAYQTTRVRNRKLHDQVPLKGQKTNESKVKTKGYIIKHEAEEVHITTANDSDHCSENEGHLQRDSAHSSQKVHHIPITTNDDTFNLHSDIELGEKDGCVDNQSDGVSSPLNQTYTIEHEDDAYARPVVLHTTENDGVNYARRTKSPEIENVEEKSVRPIASPRKSLSPHLADRFMQRPMWQNADVNELDRRVKRALRLREELQLRKQNKNSTQNTILLIQQIEQGFKKAEAVETCTEDLRPSDTDEIPSCQLDTTLNMDGIASIANTDNKDVRLDKTFRSDNNSSTSTNANTVIVNNMSSSEQPWLTQESCEDLLEHALFGNMSRQTGAAQGDVYVQKNEERSPKSTENDDESVEVAGAACLDILTDELHKIQKRKERRGSTLTSSASVYTASTQLSASSVRTESTKTDNDVVARQKNKKNTPPVKISKSDNETSQNGLRLIGELVDSLPKVPTQSMVDWFLATSDPRDFEKISKSDFSSNSSEYDIYKDINRTNMKAMKNSCSKTGPLPKLRLKSPCIVTNDSKIARAAYITPPQSFTKPEVLPSYHDDIVHISGGRIKYRGQPAVKREPSKRFHKVKERKTTPARPKRSIAKIAESEDAPHDELKPTAESDFVDYTGSRLIVNNPNLNPSVFEPPKVGLKNQRDDGVKETPRSRTSRGSAGRSLSRPRAPEPRPTRAASQPPSLPPESLPGFPGEDNFPAGIQQIIMKLRERSAATSPTESQPDKYRITIKKKSDIKGIIAKFSKR